METTAAKSRAHSRRRTVCAAAAAVLLMQAYAFFTGLNGYFMEPVTAALGCSRTAYTIQLSISSAFTLLSAPFFGKRLSSLKNLRRIILISAVSGVAAYVVMSFSREIYGIYAGAVILGLVANNGTAVCAAVLLGMAFGEKSGGPTGIVMSSTGIAGTLTGLLLPTLILLHGWRVSYIVCGGVWFLLLFSAFLLSGLAGGDTGIKSAKDKAADGGAKAPGLKMLLFSAAVLCIGVNAVFAQHMPAFFHQYTGDAVLAGRYVSFFNLSSIAVKIFAGFLYDRAGARPTLLLCAFAYIAGMWLQLPGENWLMLLGIVLFGFGHAMPNVLLPLLTRRTFGDENFSRMWSVFSGLCTVGYAIGSPSWGAVRDLRGSYDAAVLCFPLLVLLALGLILHLLPKKK